MLYVTKFFSHDNKTEYVWLHRMAYKLCPRVVFPSKIIFVQKILPTLVERTLVAFMQFALANCMSTTCIFYLWVFVRAHDVFVVVINFLFTKLGFNVATLALGSRLTQGVARLWAKKETQ